MKLTLALLENDELYLSKINSFFLKLPTIDISIEGFSSQSELERRINTAPLDIALVADGQISDNLIALSHAKGCVLIPLLSKAGASLEQGAVFKYQPIRVLLEKVKDIYYTNVLNKCKTLAFSSPVGGCGVSSVSFACAKFFAAHHRVVYISLETLGGASVFFDMPKTLSAKEILALLACEITPREAPCDSFERVRDYLHEVEEGLFVLPLDDTGVTCALTIAQLQILIQQLKKTKWFDYIVLDMVHEGFACVQQEIADEIIFVSTNTQVAQNKVAHMEKILKELSPQAPAPTVLFNLCDEQFDYTNTAHKGIPRFSGTKAKQVVDSILAYIQEESLFSQGILAKNVELKS